MTLLEGAVPTTTHGSLLMREKLQGTWIEKTSVQVWAPLLIHCMKLRKTANLP